MQLLCIRFPIFRGGYIYDTFRHLFPDILHTATHCSTSWHSISIGVTGHVMETGSTLPKELRDMLVDQLHRGQFPLQSHA